jgi:hypothetical protein
MPRRKPKKHDLSKEQEMQLKEKLDSIILADEMLAGLEAPDIPPIKEPRILNVNSVKSEVETEARSILESLSKFYNDFDDVDEENYLKKKQKIDALNISTLAFQIRTAQHAISKIIEEIDSGRVERGLFEVLAQLQNQLMQMPKNFSTYMNQMEKNYKELKAEKDKEPGNISMDENGKIIENFENSETLKVRGTKSLMESLQNSIKNGSKIKEAEIVEEKIADDLINPRTKKVTSDLAGPSDDDIDFEIEDDLFE